MTEITIYTIGYGGRTVEELIGLLHQHHITFLIDIRHQPFSRFYPDFNMESLVASLRHENIQYVFMGNTLGGLPLDKEGYVAGRVDYDRLRHTPYFQAGLRRLRDALNQKLRIALMCVEALPEQCHRSRLVGVSLAEEGYKVLHIDKDNQTVTQQEVMLRLIDNQPSLFGNDYRHLTSRRRLQPDESDDGKEQASEDGSNRS